MLSWRDSPYADRPYARPYDIALIFARISSVTSPGPTPKTRDATVVWRSSPSSNAASSASSSERCAMIRISIWE